MTSALSRIGLSLFVIVVISYLLFLTSAGISCSLLGDVVGGSGIHVAWLTLHAGELALLVSSAAACLRRGSSHRAVGARRKRRRRARRTRVWGRARTPGAVGGEWRSRAAHELAFGSGLLEPDDWQSRCIDGRLTARAAASPELQQLDRRCRRRLGHLKCKPHKHWRCTCGGQWRSSLMTVKSARLFYRSRPDAINLSNLV